MIRNNVSILICIMAWAFASCSPKITSNIIHRDKPQEWLEDVVVLKEKDPLPDDAEWMGTIDMKGKVSYDKMAEKIRFKAWEEGGKYVKIKSYGSDGVRSDIHVMKSDVFRSDTTTVPQVDKNNNDRSATTGFGIGRTAVVRSSDYSSMVPESDEAVHSVRAYVGYGRRLNKISPELNLFEKEHVKRLMNGVVFGTDFIQYFDRAKGSGLGLRYQIMHATSADPATVTYEDGTSKDAVFNEMVNISFLGLLYSGRMQSRNGKHLFVANVGGGLLLWKDVQKVDKDMLTITGRTFGLTYDLNYSCFVSEHLSLGAGISYTAGVIRNATFSDGEQTRTRDLEKNKQEGLAHMGICAQITYTF